jgi:homeobox protein cut-like
MSHAPSSTDGGAAADAPPSLSPSPSPTPPLPAAATAWSVIDLTRELDEYSAAAVEREEASAARRKALAAATREFKRQQLGSSGGGGSTSAPPAGADAFAPLLRQYQEAIDDLTRRAKAGESALAHLRARLAEAPPPPAAPDNDTGPALEAAERRAAEAESRAQKLEAEVSSRCCMRLG